MSSWHIGLSVVATDVGRVLNWFRRTSVLQWEYPVLGCYLQDCLVLGYAVFLIESELGHNTNFLLSRKYLVISTTERWRFSWYYFCNRIYRIPSSQVLAGAKLASATIDGLNIQTALIVMGVIAVAYTSIGGLQ
jgi:SSS family solute:Na+ symporter